MNKLFVLISFVFLCNVSFAQDSQLAERVVSKCEVLSELAKGGKVYSDSSELYLKLQRLSDSGELLIENCQDDILNFTSKFCSSSGNKDLCSRVGISKASDYKSFGADALPQFSLNNNLPKVENSYEFNAAGVLLLISPVSKLKFVKPVSKALATRARPLLSGAMLVFASLGLASCDDLAGPQVTCVGGQFKLIGFRSETCIDLPVVSVSYVDDQGVVAPSNKELTNHNIKVSFDSEVGYINFEGWQKLSDSNASNIFSIETLSKDFGTPIVSEENGNTVVTFNPSGFYPVGDYTINLTDFAKSSDASSILSSNNKAEYLSRVADSSNEFSAIKFECTPDLEGYHYTTDDQGNEVCLKIPTATWQFAAYLGRFIDYPTGDPRTTIKLEFNTQIGHLSDEGKFSDLTKDLVLSTLSITGLDGVNIVGSTASIDREHIKITNTASKTEIEIAPPDNAYEATFLINVFTIEFKNYASKLDESKFSNLSAVSEFINETKLSYDDEYDGFVTVVDIGSCLHSSTSSSVQFQSRVEQEGWCGVKTFDHLNLPRGMFRNKNPFSFALDKADPNITYQIDVAFIVSSSATSNGVTDSFLRDYAIPQINDIYKDSGVNVGFNVVAIEPFSNLKLDLACPTDLDSSSPEVGMSIVYELTPKMQKDYNADLVHILYSNNTSGLCGAAWLRPGDDESAAFPLFFLARWVSHGLSDITCGGLLTNETLDQKQYNFIQTLAHELGHNLGLSHDEHTIINYDEGSYPNPDNFHPSGYGYRGSILHNSNTYTYGTIMSYSTLEESLPFFSTTDSLQVKDICTNDSTRHDYDLGEGFCSDISTLTGMADLAISLGGGTNPTVDASEALQYSIVDASNYTPSDSGAVVADIVAPDNNE